MLPSGSAFSRPARPAAAARSVGTDVTPLDPISVTGR